MYLPANKNYSHFQGSVGQVTPRLTRVLQEAHSLTIVFSNSSPIHSMTRFHYY